MPLGLARSLRRQWWRDALLVNREFASLHPSPPNSDLARRRWQRGALLDQNSAFLNLSARIFTYSFARPGSVRGTRAGRRLLDEVYAFLRTIRWLAQSRRWSGCCCCPAGRGLRLPSRRQAVCAKLELDGCCYYPADEVLRAARWHLRSWSWTAAAATLSDELTSGLARRRWRISAQLEGSFSALCAADPGPVPGAVEK